MKYKENLELRLAVPDGALSSSKVVAEIGHSKIKPLNAGPIRLLSGQALRFRYAPLRQRVMVYRSLVSRGVPLEMM
jgi:hypothetical protein